MFDITKYKSESGDCPLDDFLVELKASGRKGDLNKILHFVNLLQEFGYRLPLINNKQAEKLDDMIYELRPLPHRVLYYFCSKNGKYVLLHGFEKKTNKTPPSEIEKARKEAFDYDRRIKNEKK